jgi:hypothetical protein
VRFYQSAASCSVPLTCDPKIIDCLSAYTHIWFPSLVSLVLLFWSLQRPAGDPFPRLPVYGSLDHAKSADSSDDCCWDAGSLPGDLNDYLCSLSSLYSLCSLCSNIPGIQDEAARLARKSSSLGFAAKYAAQLMDDILTPIQIDLRDLKSEKS